MVAQILENSNLDDLDDFDWWYSCDFDGLRQDSNGRTYLKLGGLATLAEVWINDERILQSQNMFVPHALDVTALLKNENRLVICFRSMTEFLKEKRPRPKWKTRLVDNQQLRWVRTTLLGHIPGWTPAISPIGPWKSIELESYSDFRLASCDLRSNCDLPDTEVSGEFTVQALPDAPKLESATLEVGDCSFALTLEAKDESTLSLKGGGDIRQLALWWPHTHGKPELHDCALVLRADVSEMRFDLGKRGFKQVALLEDDGLVGLRVNGTDVFSRGACWTNNDFSSLTGEEFDLRTSLQLAKDAGMNMLRVGGTMVYESDSFYRICDELGIMIWQDFMFANMDYPVEDSDFHQSIVLEVSDQLSRLSAHACISVYCGSSEIQQQSAMLGLEKAQWSNHFFDEELPALCSVIHADIPYFPSTPYGGALPFHVNEGLSHYYGVGAYKRDLTDVVLADVKFTPETLGFSHVPEEGIISAMFSGERAVPHDPRWKQGIPRDTGAGWDFEDIRDFYLQQLFDVDPVILRSHDPDRYFALSKVVTGELIYRVFSQWRSAESNCRGALIWFYNDLVPGAGWGLIDSTNKPKAAYFAVKRAFVSLGVFIEDKGLDGLQLHVVNEKGVQKDVELQLEAYGLKGNTTVQASQKITLETPAVISRGVDEMLGYFTDLGYKYRFGPLQHQVIVARLIDTSTDELIDDDCFFPDTYSLPRLTECSVTTEIEVGTDNSLSLILTSSQFLQSASIALRNHELSDNYFHLSPGRSRKIQLRNKATHGCGDVLPVVGRLEALNLIEGIRLKVVS